MRSRIVLWAAIGFIVVSCWDLYAFATFPNPMNGAHPIAWLLAQLTCPIAFFSMHFHVGVSFYVALFANAVTYALIGLAIEAMRLKLHHAT
jgi:hypothetical protein